MRLSKRSKKIWILFAILAVLIPFCAYSNLHITVTEYDFTHADIPTGFEGYCIVQISDLHNETFGDDGKSLVEKVAALSPDVIVLTGDMVDASNHTDYDKALLVLKQFPSIAPTYYVYGNHEQILPKKQMDSFVSMLTLCGVQYLNDETTILTASNGDTITLIGINDLSLTGFALENIMAQQQPSVFHLLLAHEPQLLHDYAQTGVDLVLSGHAHGGQFRLPFVGGLYAPDQGLFPAYTEGLHTDADTAMIISRGLGNSSFPLRLFNQPEIVSVTLHSATQSP